MSLFKKILKNFLPTSILLLLVFVPLYPKLPLIDIKNTWVYVRVEDFLVLTTVGIWIYLLLSKKVSLKTPLTIPIFAYWVAGAVATIHGVIIIFPTIANVYPNVSLLTYMRHIEYLILFFVAFSAVKSRKFVLLSIWTVVMSLVGVVAYGFGQKFLSFPAYLTMNEQYAKGTAIFVSPLGRISSTFAGHYDLAAYLVLVIPILVGLFFGFKNVFIKLFLLTTSLLGVVLLFWTVSRVSFFALFIALLVVLFFHKKKFVYIFTPLLVIAGFIFLYSHSSLLARFSNTVKEINVLVNAKTGEAIGQVSIEPRKYLMDKTILHEKELLNELYVSSPSASKIALPPDMPLALSKYRVPPDIAVVQAKLTSTGETLPQGSEYINLPLSPVVKRFDNFFYEYPPTDSSPSALVQIVPGSFLVKKAQAYDISFTTRFQGEWPNTMVAFMRNLFFGSGFGSVSLAVDNNYLRMLGESGLLGTASFILIFIVLGAYIRKTLKETDDKVIRSFVLGFAAGVIGLALNATLIDVFEASKVALQLWILVGIVVGALSLYQTKSFRLYHEIAHIASSTYAVISYFVLLTLAIFFTTLSNYFVGDDFTWFRWAADCKHFLASCSSIPGTISMYFLNSGGFFYRPGTKTYFYLMYQVFSLNPVVYHIVSISLHLIVVVLLYITAKKILKNNFLAAATGFLFLISSGYLEIVLWTSSTGHLFNAIFILTGFLLFTKWHETRKLRYLTLSLFSSVLALAFYELGIITPLLCLAYWVFVNPTIGIDSVMRQLKIKILLLLFVPDVLYLIVRFFAHTHWFSGDYSYNIIKLPFNVVGNFFGYVLISLFGPLSLPFYEKVRIITKTNIPVAIIVTVIFVGIMFFITKKLSKSFDKEERRVIIFGLLFTAICLVPFLGLGNIAFRYSYLASFGVFTVLVVIVNKLFKYFLVYGRDIATGVLACFASFFVLVHVIQAQQLIIDWHGAGERVQNFLTSIDSLYDESWSTEKVNLYFTNVPIKSNNAWVFPVGLEDAVWFVSKNDNVKVIKVPEIKDVPKDAFASKTTWVFQFHPDGKLTRIIMTKKGFSELQM